MSSFGYRHTEEAKRRIGLAARGNDYARGCFHKLGEKKNRLTLVQRLEFGGGRRAEFLCDCGTTTIVKMSNWENGHTKSCGCYRETRGKADPVKRLYWVWSAMKKRTKRNPIYTSRHIGYDPRWESFMLFARDMASSYTPGYQLHRIDSMGSYSAANCVWLSSRAHAFAHHGDPRAKLKTS